MKCYFDGSVGGFSDEWLTLGGFAASDKTWASFQADWESMCKNRDPVAPYVHMTDIITGNKAFKSANGWDGPKTKKLVYDVEDLFQSYRKRLWGFACAVDTHACKRLIAEGYRMEKPSLICAENGLGHLLTQYFDDRGMELAYLFYDQNEPFIGTIRKRYLEQKKKVVADRLLWGIIGNVLPLSMKETPGIQAADVIAWAFTRRIRNAPNDEWARIANRLIGTRQYVGMLTNTQLDPITESVMRSRYPHDAPQEKRRNK